MNYIPLYNKTLYDFLFFVAIANEIDAVVHSSKSKPWIQEESFPYYTSFALLSSSAIHILCIENCINDVFQMLNMSNYNFIFLCIKYDDESFFPKFS